MREERQLVVGVGGVVIRDSRVLLVRRAHEPLAGRWSIPGGRVEWGETLQQAVVREMREETGLDVSVGPLLEVVERIGEGGASQHKEGAAPPGSSPSFHYIILDYLCEAAAGAPQAGDDAAELAWAAESELDGYHLTEAAMRVIRRAFTLARDAQR